MDLNGVFKMLNQLPIEVRQLDAPHLFQPKTKALGSRTIPKSVSEHYI
ncbi:hypothetical protein [Parashewanella curva]|nr:hypothetical protein [Parashewanella curva]